LSILGSCTGRRPEDCAGDYTQYGPLKADTADAVVELLRPVQERYRLLTADPAELHRLLATGAAQAAEVAQLTVTRAYDALGLVPRS
jgi:tryptophanyl-tRNA synthetase